MKKIPQRMCVSCREMKPKKELLRVVKTANDEIFVDDTGKISGRGLYICKSTECVDKCKKTRAINRAFSCNVSDEVYDKIKEKLSAKQ